jgi:hypothetical protein
LAANEVEIIHQPTIIFGLSPFDVSCLNIWHRLRPTVWGVGLPVGVNLELAVLKAVAGCLEADVNLQSVSEGGTGANL